jgi:hypothetical protein
VVRLWWLCMPRLKEMKAYDDDEFVNWVHRKLVNVAKGCDQESFETDENTLRLGANWVIHIQLPSYWWNYKRNN